jgi:hypothetical protein
LTPAVLFNYLILHSEENLQSLLCIAYAQYSPIPFLSWNCWELEEDGRPKRLIQRKLLDVWDKHKSLLSLKLS